MKHLRRSFLLSVSILAVSFLWSAGPQSEQFRLQQVVEKLRQDNNLPGISVAVAKGAAPPVCATAGFADIQKQLPVSPETSFFVGSVSKNIFAVVALMLVDEGHLSLDDKLSKFVDWPRGDDVTLRMLLNHTSGIPEWLTGDLFENRVNGTPKFFASSHTPSQILAMMPNKAPVFNPGTEQQYSNTNGLLVGEVIRKVTGKELVTVLEQRVVDPLGLTHMYLYGGRTTGRPRARGYSERGATGDELVDCSYADEALPDSADGSVVTSAADLLRYHRALRNGELLTDSSWKAMNTVESGRHNGLSYLLGEGPFGPYAGNVGRAMGHVAFNVYYPDHDTYVVVLLNHGESQLSIDRLMKPWLETQKP